MTPFSLPADYPRIKRVKSFEELLMTPFEHGVNALCWERTLPGDFAEVVQELCRQQGLPVGITTLDDKQLQTLSASLSEGGRQAIEMIQQDLCRLREHERLPELNAVNGYAPVAQPGPVRTDVCSFHVDSATAEADTWLCTYHGAPSEGLRNEEAVRRVDVPETRAELLRQYREETEDAASEEETYREWLGDHCYDLHYVPAAGARPFSFGVANLWRLAVQWPGCAVPPCIHRAPDPEFPASEIESGITEAPGVRLLLIS